ncbi:Glu-tRNA(Gln) amidotransferase subunit GatE [Candidatus Pacearchaeota archaeon]|nr:Glu-tRNA(Gln) amidotransferase subunit GatE [Candidatus Pacearchaeota archaeon]
MVKAIKEIENKSLEIDYSKLGFKAGLEIHQQLDTGKKLFCNCPSYLRSDEPHFSINRKLHAVAGETGEIDVAVTHEASLGRNFIYQAYKDTTCLVELDECPPYPINELALEEALKIALLLNCEIYPFSQIMRKTVIDGSNTSGFQRTILIAHDGYLETSSGKIRVDTVCLEEDAARIVEKNEKTATYRLDRLGIPLIEIATAPDIKNPEQVKESALKIGEILRACKVKRGIGTIRQDINMSIKGHERVEIKGFQDPSMMISTVKKEIERQLQEIKDGKKIGDVRGALENGETEFLRPIPSGARMYPETDLELLKIGRDKINEIKKKLPKLKHEISSELKKKGLTDELISLILDENLDEFSTLLRVYDKDANLVAKMVSLWRSEFASKLKKNIDEIRSILSERILETILEKLVKGEISESDIKGIMLKIASGTPIDEALKIEKISHDSLEEEIEKIVKEKPGMKANAYMGLVIQKLGSIVDKRKAMEILQRIVK